MSPLKPSELPVTVVAAAVGHVLLNLTARRADDRARQRRGALGGDRHGRERSRRCRRLTRQELDQFTGGRDYQSALRLLASVLTLPTGVSAEGGRRRFAASRWNRPPSSNPSTNLSTLQLPADAVDSVQVLPNRTPSSSAAFPRPRHPPRAARGDRWKLRLNDLDPNFRTNRYNNLKVIGLQEWAPRVEFGGPIVNQRVFFEQTAQYSYGNTDIPSLERS